MLGRAGEECSTSLRSKEGGRKSRILVIFPHSRNFARTSRMLEFISRDKMAENRNNFPTTKSFCSKKLRKRKT